MAFTGVHTRAESCGGLLRRLDELNEWLLKAKQNLERANNDPSFIIMTGELESLRNKARYCFC
jgi:hypothetical protein